MNKELIEKKANELYPYVDMMPKETGYHENDVAEKQQDAFIAGAEYRDADAVGFAEWVLSCDYRLSPHTVETTWIHKDLIGIRHRAVLPSEGITTSELYEIYQQKKAT